MVEKQSTIVPKQIGKTGQIEMPKFDCEPFKGKNSEIALIETVQTQFGLGVRISTKVITSFNGKEIRASKLFSLSKNNVTGEIGWTKDSKLAKLLASFKVNHYDDLLGKPVVIITRTDTKKDMDFLDFA